MTFSLLGTINNSGLKGPGFSCTSPSTKLPEWLLVEEELGKLSSHKSGPLKQFYERLNEGDELSSGTSAVFPGHRK